MSGFFVVLFSTIGKYKKHYYILLFIKWRTGLNITKFIKNGRFTTENVGGEVFFSLSSGKDYFELVD